MPGRETAPGFCLLGERYSDSGTTRRYGWEILAIAPALMSIVICGRARRIILSLHAKFFTHCKSIVIAMSRLILQANFMWAGSGAMAGAAS